MVTARRANEAKSGRETPRHTARFKQQTFPKQRPLRNTTRGEKKKYIYKKETGNSLSSHPPFRRLIPTALQCDSPLLAAFAMSLGLFIYSSLSRNEDIRVKLSSLSPSVFVHYNPLLYRDYIHFYFSLLDL